MGGRDHSYECEKCGLWCGGLNDLECDCDSKIDWDAIAFYPTARALDNLAHNLIIAAALTRAWDVGTGFCRWGGTEWEPGCGWSAP